MLSCSVTENFFGIVVFILAGYLMRWLYCLVPMTTSQGFQMTAPVYRKGRSQQDLARLKADPHFGNWLSRFKHNIVDSAFGDQKIRATEIQVDDVDMFGPRVGFGKFKVVTEPFVPSIVFHRSPSVCVLFLVKCQGETYGLLTVQARVPAGYRYFPELLAGMMDDQTGECRLIAAREVEEEAGLTINPEHLVDLGEADLFKRQDTRSICKSSQDAYDWFRNGDPTKTHQGYFNSPGGSSESTRFYLYQQEMGKPEFQALVKRLEGSEQGVREEGERIRLILVPMDQLLDLAPDMKVGHALALRQRYLNYQAVDRREILVRKEMRRALEEGDYAQIALLCDQYQVRSNTQHWRQMRNPDRWAELLSSAR